MHKHRSAFGWLLSLDRWSFEPHLRDKVAEYNIISTEYQLINRLIYVFVYLLVYLPLFFIYLLHYDVTVAWLMFSTA